MNAPAKPKKARLDVLLVDRGFFPSREQAQRAIMAGEIKIGTRVASKASELLQPDAEIEVEALLQRHRTTSREPALDAATAAQLAACSGADRTGIRP